MSLQLLAPDEPGAVVAYRQGGKSSFVLTVDHASRRIPRSLGTLGLSPADLVRHIAWDIGALEVAHQVSAILDAPLIAQNYSRLVIDCNRRPDDPASITALSELTHIPGNVHLSQEEIMARRREVFDPYHDRVRELLDERAQSRMRTILIVQHSMTNVFKGVRREMHAAVLYDKDPRFARCLLEALRSEPGVVVGDNEPYSGKHKIGYTAPQHGEARGIPHVEVELRQDLIESYAGQRDWGSRMARALVSAERSFLQLHG
ncbi:MAG: N-formylglutamate amidohydrolase [Steroidobacteraceae bacterium]